MHFEAFLVAWYDSFVATLLMVIFVIHFELATS
jgi:hypothetical protein